MSYTKGIILIILIITLIRVSVYMTVERYDPKQDKGELMKEYESPYDNTKIKSYYLKEFNMELGLNIYYVTLIYKNRVLYNGYDGAEFDVEWKTSDTVLVTFCDPYESKCHTVSINIKNGFYNEWDMSDVTIWFNRIYAAVVDVLMVLLAAVSIKMR